VAETLMERVYLRWIATGARGDRLDALTFTLAQDPESVGREGCATSLVTEKVAHLSEVSGEAALGVGINDELKVHTQQKPLIVCPSKFSDGENPN
jgi:hypothetical protein